MKVDHLKQLKVAQRENRLSGEEFRRDFKSLSKEKREELFSPGLWWAWGYELSIVQHVGVLFWATGQVEKLKEIVAGEGDMLQALIDYAFAFDPDRDADMSLFQGEEGPGRKGLLVSAMVGLMRQLESIEREGCYLSDLVARVGNGHDVALWKALHIDRTAISCPPIGERVTRAELEDDAEFFKNLARAVEKRWQKKPPKGDKRHKDLRVMLQAVHEAGTLPGMTVTELDKLFIQELDVYSDKGEDPVRGLQRFISRKRILG